MSDGIYFGLEVFKWWVWLKSFIKNGIKRIVCFVFICKKMFFVEGNCWNFNSKDWKMDKIDK